MKPPYRIVLVLTDACNFQCVGCLREFNKANHVSVDTLRKVAKEAQEVGISHFALTGGEVSLHPNFREIVDMLTQEFAFSINVVTNGYIFDKYAFLADPKYAVRGRKPAFTVSLDGATAEVHDKSRRNGSFARAIETVRELKRLGLPVFFQSMLSKISAPTAHELIALAKELGVANLRYTNALKTQHNQEILLTSEELASARVRILSNRVPGVKVSFTASAGAPRTGTSTSMAYLCDRIHNARRLDPTLTPHGTWIWCCDLVQEGGDILGNSNTTVGEVLERMRVEALHIHEQRLLAVADPQHPTFWTCEYCNSRYNAHVQQEGTAPVKYIIPLMVKK